jgi:hypothetical protein
MYWLLLLLPLHSRPAVAGLQLRSFSSTTRTGGLVLQQLPAASLSSLQLLDLDIADQDEAAELGPVTAAMERLTGESLLFVCMHT